MKLRVYKYNKALQIVDLGLCDLNNILEILNESIVNSNQKYEHAEEAIAKTSFGVSKAENDFIEISCHGNSEISW